jgi:hypothetical protein
MLAGDFWGEDSIEDFLTFLKQKQIESDRWLKKCVYCVRLN